MQTVGLRPRLRGKRSLVDLMVGSDRDQDDRIPDGWTNAAVSPTKPGSPKLEAPSRVDELGDTRVAAEGQPGAPAAAVRSCHVHVAAEQPAEPCFEAAGQQPSQHMTAHNMPQPALARPEHQHPAPADSGESTRVTLPAQCDKTSSPRFLSTASPVAAPRQDPEAPTSVQASKPAPHPPSTSTSTAKQPAPPRPTSTSPGDPTTAPPSHNRPPDTQIPRRASGTDRTSKMAPVRACPRRCTPPRLLLSPSAPRHSGIPAPRRALQWPGSFGPFQSNGNAEVEPGPVSAG